MTVYYCQENLELNRYWCFAIGKTVAFVMTPDEVEVTDTFKPQFKALSELELAIAFPEARQSIKENIKEDKARLAELLIEEREIKNTIDQHVTHYTNNEILKEWLVWLWIESKREKINARINRNKNILFLIEQVKTLGTGENLYTNIELAKQTPISEYINFDRSGFSKCIWHNESKPSLKFYQDKNKAHCFSCDKSGDVIDIVRELYGLNFIEAVKFILKK